MDLIRKIEIIIEGGTYTEFPIDYLEEFHRDIFYTANTFWDELPRRPRKSMREEIEINWTARVKVIGICIETRPDAITDEWIKFFRYSGTTRIQLGVQHTDNYILKKINRGHSFEQSCIAVDKLKNNGFKIFSGGTDTHLMLVDLRPFNVKGNLAAESLSRANITCNKNGIPFDTESPMITSGIRLGSQAATTRGFGLKEFERVGELITKTIKGLSTNPNDNSKIEDEVRNEVVNLCSKFPIYKHLR